MSTESHDSDAPQKADCNPRLVGPLRPPIHSTVHRNYWERSLYPHPKVPAAIKDGRLLPDAGWIRVERNGEVTGFVSDGIEWSTVSLEENAAAKSRANNRMIVVRREVVGDFDDKVIDLCTEIITDPATSPKL